MELIDETYFIGTIDIPNLTTTTMGANNHDRKDELLRYINIYEDKFLRLLLGDLYSDYKTDETDKWDELKSLLVDSVNHVSPIANYVFFYCYQVMCTRNTTSGVAYTNVENQTIVNNHKLVLIWNEMVYELYKVGGVIEYLCGNRDSLETSEYCLPLYILEYPGNYEPFNFANIFGI